MPKPGRSEDVGETRQEKSSERMCNCMALTGIPVVCLGALDIVLVFFKKSELCPLLRLFSL